MMIDEEGKEKAIPTFCNFNWYWSL